MKPVGLPYQANQFKFMASAMRACVSSITESREQKLQELESIRVKLIEMTNANIAFWASHCEDGQFAEWCNKKE